MSSQIRKGTIICFPNLNYRAVLTGEKFAGTMYAYWLTNGDRRKIRSMHEDVFEEWIKSGGAWIKKPD